jgi:hypothetical protein
LSARVNKVKPVSFISVPVLRSQSDKDQITTRPISFHPSFNEALWISLTKIWPILLTPIPDHDAASRILVNEISWRGKFVTPKIGLPLP